MEELLGAEAGLPVLVDPPDDPRAGVREPRTHPLPMRVPQAQSSFALSKDRWSRMLASAEFAPRSATDNQDDKSGRDQSGTPQARSSSGFFEEPEAAECSENNRCLSKCRHQPEWGESGS